MKENKAIREIEREKKETLACPGDQNKFTDGGDKAAQRRVVML